MKAVIMAGGLGKRLKPFTEVLPKPLLPLGESSVVEILIQKLKNFGVNEIIISTFYKSDLLERYLGDGSKYGIDLSYIKEEKPLGTAGSLSLLKGKIREPFIVTNGDILTNINFSALMNFHKNNNADVTVVTKIIQVPLNYGVISSDNLSVKSIEEKPVLNFEINAGIYVINNDLLDNLKENEHYLMTDLLHDLLAKNKRVIRHPFDGYWLDMGFVGDYEKAQNDFREGKI